MDQPNYKKSDNRMKRHPELQPYVPSDRDKITSLITIRKIPTGSNSKSKTCSSLTSSLTSNTNTTTSTNNTTSTTTTTKNYRAIKAKDNKPRNQPIASTTTNTKPVVKARPVPHQQAKKNGCSQLSPSSASPNVHDQGKTYVVSAHGPAAVSATASTTTPTTVTSLDTEAARKLSNASINNTSTNTSDETSIEQLNETNGDVTIRSINSGPKANTPATEQQVTPEKPVATIKIEPCDDKDNSNSSAFENQMSDLSINERLYQSAASDLSQEINEVSTNGNYHENNVSLLHDLEAELIAEGIVKTEPVTPKLSMSLVSGDEDSIRRESTPEIKSTAHRNDKLEMLLKKDEEKRLKAEEELRENARRMEEERQSRQSLIESILSKVNQSS